MSIVNRRNAVLDWMTWLGVKSLAKSKTRAAVPAVKEKRPNGPAKVAAGAAAAVGSVVLLKRLRRRRDPVSETEGLRDSE